jgi:hypothetical protein
VASGDGTDDDDDEEEEELEDREITRYSVRIAE